MPSQSDIEVIAPNLKRRLSGVTATVVRLGACAGERNQHSGNRAGPSVVGAAHSFVAYYIYATRQMESLARAT